jgi:hypothetical protein
MINERMKSIQFIIKKFPNGASIQIETKFEEHSEIHNYFYIHLPKIAYIDKFGKKNPLPIPLLNDDENENEDEEKTDSQRDFDTLIPCLDTHLPDVYEVIDHYLKNQIMDSEKSHNFYRELLGMKRKKINSDHFDL